MQDRRTLHCLTLMCKITKKLAPIYLCNRITYHSELHNYNTRRKNDLITPFARTKSKFLSFFVETAKKFNECSRGIDVSNFSVNCFRQKCIKYLQNSENQVQCLCNLFFLLVKFIIAGFLGLICCLVIDRACLPRNLHHQGLGQLINSLIIQI